jgi:2-keto-4-pentenoate hydratase/2-oxohepta-3-ene-1,7-dioic acid hydratase in catechol pathway
MKLATLLVSGRPALHVLRNGSYLPVATLAPGLPDDLIGFIEAGDQARAALSAALDQAGTAGAIPAGEAHYLPLVPKPGKIVCLGLNYVDHAAEGGFAPPEYPAIFLRTPASLIAHNAEMIRPIVSEQLDYEVELAVIIGKRTRHATAANALASVAGYSVFNDGSIRNYQRRGAQWTIGKNFDGTGGFGPDFVTADAVSQGAKGLRITTRLNGQTVQDANTDDMIFDVARTIVIVSECMTLDPGDVIVMGTPSGVGHARKPPLWMKPGDVCECEIEGIGLLRNPIAGESERPAA